MLDHDFQLQDGDVVLLEAPQDEPISDAVAVIDGCAYSHAGFVSRNNGSYELISATLETATTRQGVSRLDLVKVNATRSLAVLHIAGGLAALKEAKRWAELPKGQPPNGNPSDFGVEQIVLASLAAAARHLEPGLPRRLLWAFAHGASHMLFKQLDLTLPCPKETPEPNDGVVDRWDCAAFVDHCFCVTRNGLTVAESDPPNKDFGAVIGAYRRLLAHLLGRLGADEQREVTTTEPTDEELVRALGEDDQWELHVADIGEVGDIIREVARLTGKSAVDAIRGGKKLLAETTTGGPWPPFMSLRQMLDAYPPDGLIPRGGLIAP